MYVGTIPIVNMYLLCNRGVTKTNKESMLQAKRFAFNIRGLTKTNTLF